MKARKAEASVTPQPNGDSSSLQGPSGEATSRHAGREEGGSGEEELDAAANYYDNVYFESTSSEEEEEEEGGGGDKVRCCL